MPDRSDDYQIPSWPPTRLDREFLNPIFKDFAVRLKAREDLEASFEALQAQGIQASLDYIQVNVAPQIANLQTSIQLAQDQINQIIIDGVSPNSLKLGGQLPAYYATAQALQDGLSGKVSTSLTINGKPLNANITLDKTDVGLDNVDNTKDADKPISTEQANALAKRVPVDAAAGFTAAEKGRAIANIGGGVLAGFRNKLINGSFLIAQLGASTTLAPGGLTMLADCWWVFNGTNQTATIFAADLNDSVNADIPGTPQGALSIQFATAPTSGDVVFFQRIEGVETLAGGEATATLWTNGPVASEALSFYANQVFGTGGSPSAGVDRAGSFDIATVHSPTTRRRTGKVTVPPVSGKTFGTNRNDYLQFGVVFTPRSAGNYSFTRVSLVEGDATAEVDPFSPRHIQQEFALCERYLQKNSVEAQGYMQASASNIAITCLLPVKMRAVPIVSKTTTAIGPINTDDLAAGIDRIVYSLITNGSGSGLAYAAANYTLDARL